MKKILTTMVIMLGVGTAFPVFAVCSLTGGACSALDQPSLNERYVPNHLQEMQKTDAFTPDYQKPYYDMLLNTDTPETAELNGTRNYNSNCQFGVCLPEESAPAE